MQHYMHVNFFTQFLPAQHDLSKLDR